jgi:ribosome assembly protein 1
LERNKGEETADEAEKVVRDFNNDIETGFQLATFQGPLCAEPVEGIAYFVERVEIDRDALNKEIGALLLLPK